MRNGLIGLSILAASMVIAANVDALGGGWNWLIALAAVTAITALYVFLQPGDRTAKLIKFAEEGDIPKVRELLEKDKAGKVIDDMGANGNRLLHYAAGGWKEPDLVAKIIDLGAEVDTKNIWKRTPLHAAAEANNLKAIRILLDRGADMHAPDIHQITPLDIARKKKKKRTIELLQSFESKTKA